MEKVLVSILLVFQSFAVGYSQYIQKGVDTVYAVQWGEDAGFGQEYFPQNIFGLPDSLARWTVPSSNPQQICALGLDGSIILGWKGFLLIDGPGPDFTVFENAFAYGNGKIYVEPAVISVSSDGITFLQFPCDSITLQGCAGRTPTNGGKNPFDPSESGGDSFDLSAIGVDSVRFIKIHDVCSIIRNNRSHPFWDPTINGFDLDAVVGLHLVPIFDKGQDGNIIPILLEDGVAFTGQLQSIAIFSYDGRLLTTVTDYDPLAKIPLPKDGFYLFVVSHNQRIFRFGVLYRRNGGGGWFR